MFASLDFMLPGAPSWMSFLVFFAPVPRAFDPLQEGAEAFAETVASIPEAVQAAAPPCFS